MSSGELGFLSRAHREHDPGGLSSPPPGWGRTTSLAYRPDREKDLYNLLTTIGGPRPFSWRTLEVKVSGSH